MRKRVVITGMGTVNPVGNTVATFWDGIKSGRSGVGPITKFDPKDHVTRYAAEIKNFDIRDFIDRNEARKMETFSHYAVASAVQAWKDSGMSEGKFDPERLGVILGVGMGGFETLETAFRQLIEKGPTRVHPMTVPKIISNIGPGNIAIMLNAQGPCYSMATACASGTDAIGNSFRMILDDMCDVMVTGGVEAIITPLGIAGFNVIHALSSKHNDDPERASRPFDRDRDGFVMGEGAGVLVLEELEHAKARGAKIYAEIAGFGASNDAYHLTAPHPEGRGAIVAMKMAMRVAGITPDQVDYINAHGTSTEMNDVAETRAVKAVYGENTKVRISSTKSMTGHMIGAAGAVEAIICAMAIQDQFFPPTINLDNPDTECTLDYVPNKGYSGKIDIAVSNSLGFGGHNGILVIRRFIE